MKIYNVGSVNVDYVYQVPHFVRAGDTFTGYFLAMTARGEDAQQALRTATLAASIAVSPKGAAVSIPWADEVLRS